MRILITGGAGFIGRYTARACLTGGHSVRILDNYSPQIHGQQAPAALNAELRAFIAGADASAGSRLEFVTGDICDATAMRECLAGVDTVVHLAAETGTGQSMYDVVRYERVNIGGTALLAELLASGQFPQVRRVVLASSRAVYGEGQYACSRCGPVFPPLREVARVQAGEYEPRCPSCRGVITHSPTTEAAPRTATSFYGLTKSVQEDIIRLFAQTTGFSAFLLRFQNVYGPMQSLNNPYTGILSIFSTLARDNETIKVFEDGVESRDFVYVEDVARAIAASTTQTPDGIFTFNLGTGMGVTVREVAETIKRTLHSSSEIVVTGQFRAGDIRHAVADITAARRVLGFVPTVAFHEGVERFVRWAVSQNPGQSRYEQSLGELTARGLLHERSTPARQ